MIDIKSYVDNLEILHSAQVPLVLNQILKIEFSSIKIEIQYIKDPKLRININYKLIDGILKIIFENYTDMTGGGVLRPWRIGEYQGKELYLTIFGKDIIGFEETFIICDYALYLGKPVSL